MSLPLFEYQDQGAAFLSTRQRAGLFDEMGLGKSAQAIRAADLIRATRGVVICPAGVRDVWRGEFAKFGLMKRRVVKAANIHDFLAWQRGRFDVIVMSYEHAVKWAAKFDEAAEFLPFVIIDELHYTKNSETARTIKILGNYAELHAADGIVKWAEYAWGLTGTPMANDPMDIYTFLRFVGAMPLKQALFKKRYFSTFQRTFGERNKARPNIVEELKRLIQNNSMRRTMKEAGVQLPDIWLTDVTLDGDATELNQLLAEYPGLDGAIMQALQSGGLSFLDAQHVATLRRLVGEAKAIPYAALLYEELMNCTDKYVVMGIHKKALLDVRDYLIRRGIRCVIVQGDTSERERAANVIAFQTENSDVRVFIGNIKAAGTGLTLTAACKLDMLESDWTPAGNAQAIKRVHRIGQKSQVRARFITLADSIDEAVNRIVAEKTAAIASIEGEAMNSHPPVDRYAEVS